MTGAAVRLRELAPAEISIDGRINAVVDKLLQATQQTQPPVNLEAIAKLIGVVSIREEDLPVDGYTIQGPDGYQVVIDSRSPRTRQRFTLAHELGHVLMERDFEAPPRPGRALEQICDEFASQLLMPRRVFVQQSKDSPPDQLTQLASTFGCSLSAAARRYARLFGERAAEVSHGAIRWEYPRGVGKDVAKVVESCPEGGRLSATIGGVFSNWRIHRVDQHDGFIGILSRR